MQFTISENESTFSKDLVLGFFDQVTTFSDEWAYNIFSFLGWYGVPVFIFLTGFGLVRKYETEKQEMNKPAFLFDNWFKLLALMLPGVICFVTLDIVSFVFNGNEWWLTQIPIHTFNLTFLNFILCPWVDCDPGVYWYFGLTLEFYLLYAYAVYKRPIRVLAWLTLASIALQAAVHTGIFGDHELMLWWVRKNITGWMLPFSFGIIYARRKAIPTVWTYMIVIAAVILFFPLMLDQSFWQVTLLCAIVMTIVAARISLKIPYWRAFWIYIGRLSPFIFAAHPIVRSFIYRLLSPKYEPDASKLIIYIIMVMICAILYKISWKYTTQTMKSLISKAVSAQQKLLKKPDTP